MFNEIIEKIKFNRKNNTLKKINADIKNSDKERFFGHIDYIDSDNISGWAFDYLNPNKSATIKVYIEGSEINEACTSLQRIDIQNLMGGRKNRAAFLMSSAGIGEEDLKGKKVIIIADFGEGNVFEIPCPVEMNSRKTKSFLIQGQLDVVKDNGYVAGWCSKSNSNDSIEIEVYLDGNLEKTILANKVRQDFIDDENHNVNSGFEFYLDRGRLENSSILELRVGDFNLKNSPYKLEKNKAILNATDFFIKNGVVQIGVEISGDVRSKLCLNIDEKFQVKSEFSLKKGKSSIFFQLDNFLLDGQYHVFRLSGCENDLECISDAVLLRSHEVEFHIDAVTDSKIVGWIGDQCNTELILKLKGAQKLTSIDRPDVFKAKGYLSSGFEIEVDKTKKEGLISIVDSSSNIDILNIYISNSFYLNSKKIKNSYSESNIEKKFNSENFFQSKYETVLKAEALPYKTRNTVKERLTVILPVYSGVSETVECIESVLSSKNKSLYRLIVINDKSPDEKITKYLRNIQHRFPEGSILIEKTINRGFSYAVNIGIILSGGEDVILLNADTVVSDGWLDKLKISAYSENDIGTVTPFSNNAEICTLPYTCKSLHVEDHETAKKINYFAEKHAIVDAINIPVAIGFCMFIKNDCINDIGLFDYATWGRGYGEEVDFCMKASSFGWRHVISPKTFVVHRGNISFGDEKIERIKESSKKIANKYPFYDAMIESFLKNDSVSEVRKKINIEIISSFLNGERILHISHSYGGGTKKYVDDYIGDQLINGNSPVLLEIDSDGNSKLKFNLKNKNKLSVFFDEHEELFDKNDISGLKNAIQSLKFKRIHFHSPFGMSVDFITWLRENFKYCITLHDYAWMCKSVNLGAANDHTSLCGVDGYLCAACRDISDVHPGLSMLSLKLPSSETYRDYFREFFDKASELIAGGDYVRNIFSNNGFSGNYKVIPHKEIFLDEWKYKLPKYQRGSTLRVALFGAISQIKGSKYLELVAKFCKDNGIKIQFIIFGYTDNKKLNSYDNVRITGKYQSDKALLEMINNHQPHVAFFPNTWPETYSYTLSIAIKLGLPVLVSDLGVPAERVDSLSNADKFDLRDDTFNVVSKLFKLSRDF